MANVRAAEAARGEAQRIREDAGRQMDQLRQDFNRQQDEYRTSLAGMRETVQAIDEDRRRAAQERDGLQAELVALRAAQKAAKSQPKATGRQLSGKRSESKTARFLALVQERYSDLAEIDLDKVSRIASELAPEVGLDPGAARSALRPRVIAARQEATR